MPNILSLQEEEEFIRSIGSWPAHCSEHEMNDWCGQTLKHRQVKHFGYEFLYCNNNVDKSKPLLNQKIPDECDILWSRLGEKIPVDKRPDQLTVNKYLPGQGNSLKKIILLIQFHQLIFFQKRQGFHHIVTHIVRFLNQLLHFHLAVILLWSINVGEMQKINHRMYRYWYRNDQFLL